MIAIVFGWVKKLGFLIWILGMLLAGAWLANENSNPVSLTIFSFPLPDIALGVLIWMTLLLGVLLGFFTYYLVSKPSAIAKKRALSKANKELASLRTGYLKE